MIPPIASACKAASSNQISPTARAILDELLGPGQWAFSADRWPYLWLGNGDGRRFVLTEKELQKPPGELRRLVKWRHEQVISSPRPMPSGHIPRYQEERS